MPGIHLRPAGQPNRRSTGQREPALTVPGSYWLCHKKNVYKFTFEYHQARRNVKHFPYERELMKVIRRVIKHPPVQGQQFSTQHLFITFNNTFWTRQDKMFAMLKFRDRLDAAAFPQAFILSIRIACPAESTVADSDCISLNVHKTKGSSHSAGNASDCQSELGNHSVKATDSYVVCRDSSFHEPYATVPVGDQLPTGPSPQNKDSQNESLCPSSGRSRSDKSVIVSLPMKDVANDDSIATAGVAAEIQNSRQLPAVLGSVRLSNEQKDTSTDVLEVHKTLACADKLPVVDDAERLMISGDLALQSANACLDDSSTKNLVETLVTSTEHYPDVNVTWINLDRVKKIEKEICSVESETQNENDKMEIISQGCDGSDSNTGIATEEMYRPNNDNGHIYDGVSDGVILSHYRYPIDRKKTQKNTMLPSVTEEITSSLVVTETYPASHNSVDVQGATDHAQSLRMQNIECHSKVADASEEGTCRPTEATESCGKGSSTIMKTRYSSKFGSRTMADETEAPNISMKIERETVTKPQSFDHDKVHSPNSGEISSNVSWQEEGISNTTTVAKHVYDLKPNKLKMKIRDSEINWIDHCSGHEDSKHVEHTAIASGNGFSEQECKFLEARDEARKTAELFEICDTGDGRVTQNSPALRDTAVGDTETMAYVSLPSADAPDAVKFSPSNEINSYLDDEDEDDFELKIDPEEVAAPRSSDITALVMGGLMFTIRQDNDNIKVEEQRTKLEMDEVLENSEKAETIKGEKCLVNSSLLRLENLITKIEAPRVEKPSTTMIAIALCDDSSRTDFSEMGKRDWACSRENDLKTLKNSFVHNDGAIKRHLFSKEESPSRQSERQPLEDLVVDRSVTHDTQQRSDCSVMAVLAKLATSKVGRRRKRRGRRTAGKVMLSKAVMLGDAREIALQTDDRKTVENNRELISSGHSEPSSDIGTIVGHELSWRPLSPTIGKTSLRSNAKASRPGVTLDSSQDSFLAQEKVLRRSKAKPMSMIGGISQQRSAGRLGLRTMQQRLWDKDRNVKTAARAGSSRIRASSSRLRKANLKRSLKNDASTNVTEEEEDIVPEALQCGLVQTLEVTKNQQNISNIFGEHTLKRKVLESSNEDSEEPPTNQRVMGDLWNGDSTMSSMRRASKYRRRLRSARTISQALLMDDSEPDDDFPSPMVECSSFGQPRSGHFEWMAVQKNSEITIRNNSKTPRVVSNTVITEEQIPPSLRAIRHKLLRPDKTQESQATSVPINHNVSSNISETTEYRDQQNSVIEMSPLRLIINSSETITNDGMTENPQETLVFSRNTADNNEDPPLEQRALSEKFVETPRKSVWPKMSPLKELHEVDPEVLTEDVLEKMFPTTDGLVTVETARLNLTEKEDVTQDFHLDLIRQKKRNFIVEHNKLRKRRIPITKKSDRRDDEPCIEIWKLMQDITQGAKVVVERISKRDIENATAHSVSCLSQ